MLLDAYRPARRAGAQPGVLLVNGDADEATIARAKDWGVYHSYGEHLAARGLVGIPFVHHSTARGKRYAEVAREIDAATGAELANDAKFEIYWYENVVLWTALGRDGKLQMAVQRPTAAGGGYRLRTLDPLTLKILSDTPHSAPPAIPGR